MVISVCSVAVVADLDRRSIQVGLGSVGPTVLRAPEAEELAGSGVDWDGLALPDPSVAATFGRLVSAASRPIDDHRATAAYRRHCVGVLAERALFRMFPGARR
jgi:CO/xanthine dehydrogenase FAD-binding subunit